MINVRSGRDLTAEWQQLVEQEPALAELEAEARAYAKLDRIKRQLLRYEGLLPREVRRWAEWECANYWWYRPYGLKERMSRLVGWSAADPKLRTREAYDTAYEYLYKLLPPCRGCACA